MAKKLCIMCTSQHTPCQQGERRETGKEGAEAGGGERATFSTGPGSVPPPTRSRGRCTPAIPHAWPPRTARRCVSPGRHGPRRPSRACPTLRGGRAAARRSDTCAARGSSSRRCSDLESGRRSVLGQVAFHLPLAHAADVLLPFLTLGLHEPLVDV